MKKVYQTIIDEGNGNCMQAAIASLFELPLEKVPNFIEIKDWFPVLWDFLAEQGYEFNGMLYNYKRHKDCSKDPKLSFTGFADVKSVKGYYYASVYSPKYNPEGIDSGVTHAVLIDKDFNIVHDPNPGYKDLEKYPLADEIGFNGVITIMMIEPKEG